MARHTQSKWIILGEINAGPVRVLLGTVDETYKAATDALPSPSHPLPSTSWWKLQPHCHTRRPPPPATSVLDHGWCLAAQL